MRVTIGAADWTDPSDKACLEASADLVYESARDFYDSFSLSQDAIRENLVLQMQDGASALGYSIVAKLEGALAGIAVYYASEAVRTRELVSLRYLMQVRNPHPNMLERLRSLKSATESLTIPRYAYLARIAVASTFRRFGVAGLLTAAMECDSKSEGIEYICSHVSRDNTATVRMHLARGFTRVSDGDYRFVAMAKRLR